MHARNAHYAARYAHSAKLPPTAPPPTAWAAYPPMTESASYTNAEAAEIVTALAERLDETRAGQCVADAALVAKGRDLAKELLAWA